MLELREESAEGLADWRWMLAGRQTTLRTEKIYDDPAVAADKALEMVDRLLGDSRGFLVHDEDRAVGHLWWGRDREDAAVLDCRLDEPHRVDELLPHLLDLARADGARRIGCSGLPDDATRTALVALPGFAPVAANMELWLDDAPIGDPGELELRAMTEAEFDSFYAGLVSGYADELHAAGMSREAADQQSRTQTAELMPDRLASPGQVFFTGQVGTTPVGTLWISTERPMAFVYDIVVRSDQRRRGYGAAMMNAGARWCAEHGHFALGLNVFAHNPGARALYDSLGYVVTVDYRALDVPDAG